MNYRILGSLPFEVHKGLSDEDIAFMMAQDFLSKLTPEDLKELFNIKINRIGDTVNYEMELKDG